MRRVTMDQLMARLASGVDRLLLGGAAAGVGQVLMTKGLAYEPYTLNPKP